MTKRLDLSDLEIIKEQLSKFIWTFKVGDNILYNFEVLKELYNAKNNSNNIVLNKPITITIVSIIEAILIDFVRRIGEATNHKPANIPSEKLMKLKSEIRKDSFKNSNFYKRKLYHYKETIKLFQNYELFGSKEDSFYSLLDEFGVMRNRVHIENYYQNLERDEAMVFTNSRLENLEKILYQLWNKMVSDYTRPW